MKTLTSLFPLFVCGLVLVAQSGCDRAPSSAWKPKPAGDNEVAKSERKDAPAKPQAAVSKSPKQKVPDVAKETPVARKPAVARKPKDRDVADFALTERSGRTIRRADLLGKPWVACFIFTHCAGFCNNISAKMYGLQEYMKAADIDGVTIVSISVDPKRDTPEVLRRYAKNFGADEKRWLFLTGKQEDVFRLIRKGFDQTVFDVEGEIRKPGYEVEHTDAVMLVDERGRVVKKYNAMKAGSIEKLKVRLQHWKDTGTFKIASAKKADEPRGGGAK